MSSRFVLLLLLAGFVSVPAAADPHKDESGHGRRGDDRREHKEEYWDGNCKVERKFERNGGYKEERKCRGGGRGHVHRHGVPHSGAVYEPAPAPGVYVTPPSVVIQPPAVIVR